MVPLTNKLEELRIQDLCWHTKYFPMFRCRLEATLIWKNPCFIVLFWTPVLSQSVSILQPFTASWNEYPCLCHFAKAWLFGTILSEQVAIMQISTWSICSSFLLMLGFRLGMTMNNHRLFLTTCNLIREVCFKSEFWNHGQSPCCSFPHLLRNFCFVLFLVIRWFRFGLGHTGVIFYCKMQMGAI